MNEYRYSDEEFEYRADDSGPGVVSGIIVRYGDVAKIGQNLTEHIEREAFDIGTTWWANRMHQRATILGATGSNLTLTDSPEALRFQLTLPPTQAGKDAGYELEAGFLKGASIELGTVTARFDGLRRVVQKSTAVRFGLVDQPAYPDSLLNLNRWEDWEGYQGEEPQTAAKRHFLPMV